MGVFWLGVFIIGFFVLDEGWFYLKVDVLLVWREVLILVVCLVVLLFEVLRVGLLIIMM